MSEPAPETKEPEPIGLSLRDIIIITGIIFIIGFLMFYTMKDSMYEYAIEKAGKDIDCCMNNVSKDYIQGWKDCLARIEKYRTENMNVTAGT